MPGHSSHHTFDQSESKRERCDHQRGPRWWVTAVASLQGYLAHKKHAPSQGPLRYPCNEAAAVTLLVRHVRTPAEAVSEEDPQEYLAHKNHPPPP